MKKGDIMAVQKPRREPRPITRETIERLRKTRERIRQKHLGVYFGDSAEIIRQMREERSEYLAELCKIL